MSLAKEYRAYAAECMDWAKNIGAGFIDGKTFHCEKHGEFQVSDSVLSVPALMDADTSKWEAALKNAAWRADPGMRPRILSYDFQLSPPQSNS